MESLAVILITKSRIDYELYETAKNFDRYLIVNQISENELNKLKAQYELSLLVEHDFTGNFPDTIIIHSSGQGHEEVVLDPNRSIRL